MKRLLSSFLLMIILFSLVTCKKKEPKQSNDSKYAEYISEYTTGMISKKSTIRLRLAKSVDLTNQKISQDNMVTDAVFTISPKINGKTQWLDDRTIVIYPDKDLPSGRDYHAELRLKELFEVTKDIDVFSFNFSVINQNYDITQDEISMYEKDGMGYQKISGIIETADTAENKDIEKMLKLNYKKNSFKTEWDHKYGTNKHKFTINDLLREEKTYMINLDFNGASIGVSENKKLEYEIYGLKDFTYLNFSITQSPELYLDMNFSMLLNPKQDLKGIIEITGDNNPKYFIEKNIIRYYPSSSRKNSIVIKISKMLKDISNNTLIDDVEFSAAFSLEKPLVQWLNKKGGILPSSDGLLLSFEAITLKAVDITVVEIFENNIVQFLQVNKNLAGNREIKRVGRPVLYKTVELDKTSVKNLYEWNRFNINLSDVVNLKPGSLYQVRINFRISQSLYRSEDASTDVQEVDEIYKENFDAESMNRGDYYDYYYDDEYYNDWNNRDNPLKLAYYGRRRQISMNILASDIGIIAKGSETGELKVFVSDITTTKPISGVNIEAYNYQNQLLESAKTDSSGFVTLNLKGVPFVIVAKKDKQRGYLKTDDGSSLSLSNFDVGGTSSSNGIKGFLYGERGVWRPGDTVYLYFILEDKKKMLPSDYPVIFELRDPNGQLAKKVVKKDNVYGIYDFTFNTSSEDITGNWDANVRIGKDIFNKKIKIETIKPNRLKVDLNFGKDALRIEEGNAKANLEVKWLHGAPGKNLKVEYELGYLPMKTMFKDYFAYNFDDPSKKFSSTTESVFSGYTDENGKASFEVELTSQGECSGALRSVFMGKVFEEGGDFSIDNLEIPYYPYTEYAGIKMPEVDKSRSMYLEGSEYKVDIVSVDSSGKPVPNKNLDVEIYRMSWRWWWDRNDSEWENYVSTMYEHKVLSDTINTDKNGKGSYKLKINDDWGRFLFKVTDPISGHSAGNLFYVYWSGWGTSKQKDELGAATMLSIYSDKEQYQVGDTALLTIPSSSDGRALVSIENGSGVIDSFWMDTKQGKTEFKIKMTPKMAPNVYVNTTLIQPHAQVKNDLPIRLYGIVPIKVIDPDTKLEPIVSVPDTMEPEKEFNLTVKEKKGKSMAYTIAVVDEGLLDITNFKTPNPWDLFYSKEALGVKTWDVYEDVIGAMAKIFGPILSIGGGEDAIKPPSAQKANRFKPVVKCFGPFYLNGGETKKHSFVMPRYIGSVKTMVVAADNGAYGCDEKITLVKNDLMVLGTMPRVIGPGESLSLPVNVFVLNNKIKNVTVSIKTEGVLLVDGESSKQVTFDKSEDKFVNFNLKVKEAIGIGKVNILATSGQNKATYDVELNSRIATTMITDVQDIVLNAGKKHTFQTTLMGLEGTNKQTVEISYLPPINLTKRLEFLIQYPHGCIEQTTSGVFPQLFLQDITQLSPVQKSEIENNIRAAIDRLKSFKLSSGAFSYWPGSFDVSDWGTTYAGHFLIEAREKGYPVSDSLINDWINYQTDLANKWNYTKNGWYDHSQAYRLYTLALAGKPALGAMNRLKDVVNLDPIAKWRLAASYALIGKKDVAQDIISKTVLKYSDYIYDYYTYGSELRDKAMALETLILLGKKEDGFKLLQEISEKLGQDNWCSTQTTAYCLISFSRFGMSSSGSPISCKYIYGQDSGVITGNKPVITKDLKPGFGSFVIENNGKQLVYVKIVSRGTPIKGLEKESENIIKMNLRYYDKNGVQIKDLSRIKQGMDIVVETSVFNDGTYGTLENLALTQIFPSGWEIINTRLNDIQDFDNSSLADYKDIRDDRVMIYFKLRSNESKIFNITINAAYLGKFYASGANCEAMYNDKVFARKAGKEILIEK